MNTKSRIVTREEWTAARRALLAKEKAFTRERDSLSAARRGLPIVKIDKSYAFRAPLPPGYDGLRMSVPWKPSGMGTSTSTDARASSVSHCERGARFVDMARDRHPGATPIFRAAA